MKLASVSDARYKQRAVIEFLVAEKESVENIHRRLCAVYGSCAVDRSTVGRWVQRVKASESGETDLHDRPRSIRPATATSPDMLQRADVIIRADRRITSRQLAVQLSVSNGSAMAIIDALGYSKVCARCVPRSLTTEQRRQRKAIRSELLERFDADGEAFCPGSSQVTKLGLNIMSRRRKGNQCSDNIRNHQERRSSRQLLPPKSS